MVDTAGAALPVEGVLGAALALAIGAGGVGTEEALADEVARTTAIDVGVAVGIDVDVGVGVTSTLAVLAVVVLGLGGVSFEHRSPRTATPRTATAGTRTLVKCCMLL